ncbi:hypothetical protein ACWIID_21900 [Streptomyces phaeochromogenes]
MHVDLLKVAHHGSDHNLSNELLDLIDYRDRAAVWDVTGLKDRFGYTVAAPAPDEPDGFVALEL